MCSTLPPSSQLVDTTVEIANKVGAAEITSRVVEDLKDENEQYRKMVMDCIEKVGGETVGVSLMWIATCMLQCRLGWTPVYVRVVYNEYEMPIDCSMIRV